MRHPLPFSMQAGNASSVIAAILLQYTYSPSKTEESKDFLHKLYTDFNRRNFTIE